MKKQWTESELLMVQGIVRRWINSRKSVTRKNGLLPKGMTYRQIERCLGLAYTSSGAYAGLWICNDELYLDEGRVFAVHGFCMDDYGVVYAVCLDRDENDIFVPVS